jgi:hypothetical protein
MVGRIDGGGVTMEYLRWAVTTMDVGCGDGDG